MHLPAGTIDYRIIRSNLELMRQPNYEPWMEPLVVQAKHRDKAPRRKHSKLAQFPADVDVIIFPSGCLGSNGEFFGSPALAAHLERIIRRAG